MTQQDLDNISWVDIELLEDDAWFILILVCTTKDKAQHFLELLSNNPFSISVSVDEQSNGYTIELKFTGCASQISCHTRRTKENYNRLSWLQEHKLTHISTAYRDADNRLLPVPEVLPLSSFMYS